MSSVPFLRAFLSLGGLSLALPLAVFISITNIWQRRYAEGLLWSATFGVGLLTIVLLKLVFAFTGASWLEVAFYSVSGHAMLTAAIYPVLFAAIAIKMPSPLSGMLKIAGWCIPLLMSGILVLEAFHTLSETLVGFLIGGMVAFVNLKQKWTFNLRAVSIAFVLAVIFAEPAGKIVRRAAFEAWVWTKATIGVSGRYVRAIEKDPVTGHTVITVRPSSRDVYRKSM